LLSRRVRKWENRMKPSVLSDLHVQSIVDKKGKKTGVILDLKLFEARCEELEDLHDIAQAEEIIRKGEKRYSLEEAEQALLDKK